MKFLWCDLGADAGGGKDFQQHRMRLSAIDTYVPVAHPIRQRSGRPAFSIIPIPMIEHAAQLILR